jgi:hypothetical protein
MVTLLTLALTLPVAAMCLDHSEVGTAVRNDCMAMIDLIPKTKISNDEAKIRETFLEGVIAYGEGDFIKARAIWTGCLASAAKGTPTWSDCKDGLAKLDADKKPFLQRQSARRKR